jgi:hypothetical protein
MAVGLVPTLFDSFASGSAFTASATPRTKKFPSPRLVAYVYLNVKAFALVGLSLTRAVFVPTSRSLGSSVALSDR